MELFQNEIFGPVVSVKKFSTGIKPLKQKKHIRHDIHMFISLLINFNLVCSEQEALDIANDCRTGLAGYFYSNDIKQCWRVGKRLQTGANKQ